MNKATREKKRRERLNERFSELGALLDLTGANVDKLRVLSEAISTLKSLREEVRAAAAPPPFSQRTQLCAGNALPTHASGLCLLSTGMVVLL